MWATSSNEGVLSTSQRTLPSLVACRSVGPRALSDVWATFAVNRSRMDGSEPGSSKVGEGSPKGAQASTLSAWTLVAWLNLADDMTCLLRSQTVDRITAPESLEVQLGLCDVAHVTLAHLSFWGSWLD